MAYNTYRDKEKLKIYLRRKNARLWESRRRRVIERMGGICVHCGITEKEVLQIDHKIPLGTGMNRPTLAQLFPKILRGEYDMSNLQLLCANCHMKKTTNERKAIY